MGPRLSTLPLLVALASLSAPRAGAEPGGASHAGDLAVTLSLGATRLAPGEELVATVELRNRGTDAIAVLVPSTFLDGLAVRAPGGSAVERGSGLQVLILKPDSYPGRAVLLEPGQRHSFAFGMYLDDRRRLYCSLSAAEGRIAPEVAAARDVPPDLPARYDAPGSIFRLPAPGSYRIVYRIEQTGADRSWRPSGGAPAGWAARLWLGKAESLAALEVR